MAKKEKEPTKLIVVMECVGAQFVQSPHNRKSYKTWDGAMANLIGVGFGRSDLKILEQTNKCWVVEWTFQGKTTTQYLVDVLAEALQVASTSETGLIYAVHLS